MILFGKRSSCFFFITLFFYGLFADNYFSVNSVVVTTSLWFMLIKKISHYRFFQISKFSVLVFLWLKKKTEMLAYLVVIIQRRWKIVTKNNLMSMSVNIKIQTDAIVDETVSRVFRKTRKKIQFIDNLIYIIKRKNSVQLHMNTTLFDITITAWFEFPRMYRYVTSIYLNFLSPAATDTK